MDDTDICLRTAKERRMQIILPERALFPFVGPSNGGETEMAEYENCIGDGTIKL